MADVLQEIEGLVSKVDVNKVMTIAATLVTNWPTIKAVGADIEVYIEQLENAFTGKPVDIDKIHSMLQSGTDALHKAAEEDG